MRYNIVDFLNNTNIFRVFFPLNIVYHYLQQCNHCNVLNNTNIYITPHFYSLYPYNVAVFDKTFRGRNVTRTGPKLTMRYNELQCILVYYTLYYNVWYIFSHLLQ